MTDGYVIITTMSLAKSPKILYNLLTSCCNYLHFCGLMRWHKSANRQMAALNDLDVPFYGGSSCKSLTQNNLIT